MPFAQLIEYTTAQPEKVKQLHDQWERATHGKRSAKRSLLMHHHGDPSRFCELVFFDSHEAATQNSAMPETDEFAKKLTGLIDGEPSFYDLDVVEDRKL